MHVCLCLCMFVCVCIYMCVCVWIFVCVCMFSYRIRIRIRIRSRIRNSEKNRIRIRKKSFRIHNTGPPRIFSQTSLNSLFYSSRLWVLGATLIHPVALLLFAPITSCFGSRMIWSGSGSYFSDRFGSVSHPLNRAN